MRARHRIGACTAVLALTGCSGAVEVDVPTPDPDTASVCTELVRDLPDTVADQDARSTEPADALTAAWGDPAIVLRCGVPDPAALEPTSQVFSVDGVEWFPEELTAGYVFTTYGRTANVEVTVPDDYSPEAGPLTDLADAVQQNVPRTLD